MVAVTFNPPSDNGSAITAYNVTTYITWTGASGAADVSGMGTLNANGSITMNVTGLITDGTSYQFRVAAQNASGWGTPSPASNSAIPITVPSAPRIQTCTAGNAQAMINWQAPVNNGYDLSGPKYTVSVQPAGSNPDITLGNTTTFDPSSTFSATIYGLNNGTQYTVTVTCTNSVGSASASTTVQPRTVPNPPNLVKYMCQLNNKTNTFTLSWSAPSFDGGSPVTNYAISVSAYINSKWTVVVPTIMQDPSILQYTTPLLQVPDYYYNISLNAINVAGHSTSVFEQFQTHTPPVAVTIVALSGGDGCIRLSHTFPAQDYNAVITKVTYVATPVDSTDTTIYIDYNTNMNPSWQPTAMRTTGIPGLINGAIYNVTVMQSSQTGGDGPVSAAKQWKAGWYDLELANSNPVSVSYDGTVTHLAVTFNQPAMISNNVHGGVYTSSGSLVAYLLQESKAPTNVPGWVGVGSCTAYMYISLSSIPSGYYFLLVGTDGGSNAIPPQTYDALNYPHYLQTTFKYIFP